MSDMRPLQHSLLEDLCDPKLRQALQMQIIEALGESATVEVGKAYVVRGSYTSTDPSIARLCLSGHGRFQGKPADITQGSGEFEVTANPLKVEEGQENVLDLLMFDDAGAELGVRLRCQLANIGQQGV